LSRLNLDWGDTSKNVKTHEIHKQIGQHLAVALGNVYGTRHPAKAWKRKNFNIGTVEANNFFRFF